MPMVLDPSPAAATHLAAKETTPTSGLPDTNTTQAGALPCVYDFPPELWLEIFSFACTDGGCTGCSLSLVSRTFNKLSSPYRYQSLAICGLEQLVSLLKVLKVKAQQDIGGLNVKYLFFSTYPMEPTHYTNLWSLTPRRTHGQAPYYIKRFNVIHDPLEYHQHIHHSYFTLLTLLSPTLEILHEYRPTKGVTWSTAFSSSSASSTARVTKDLVFWRASMSIKMIKLREYSVGDVWLFGHPGERGKVNFDVDYDGSFHDYDDQDESQFHPFEVNHSSDLGLKVNIYPPLDPTQSHLEACFPALERLHLTDIGFDSRLLEQLPGSVRHIRFFEDGRQEDADGLGFRASQAQAIATTIPPPPQPAARTFYISHANHTSDSLLCTNARSTSPSSALINPETTPLSGRFPHAEIRHLGPEFPVDDPIRLDREHIPSLKFYSERTMEKWIAGVKRAKDAWVRRMNGEVWWSEAA
ncbi:hypothetical protein AX16_008943 [Volvariella volvacea WC 439]|nr:hypothetical protein AX16_008943 [Volvariella volvacea WC 439]